MNDALFELLTFGLVDLQKHRDAWRDYAYGKRSRPADYLGQYVHGPEPTAIDTLRDEVERLQALLDADGE